MTAIIRNVGHGPNGVAAYVVERDGVRGDYIRAEHGRFIFNYATAMRVADDAERLDRVAQDIDVLSRAALATMPKEQ